MIAHAMREDAASEAVAPTRRPQVSVVIATYNRSALLRQALESVRRQTFGDWECLVCDDGSTDDTPDVVREWAVRDARFRLVAGPRFGYPAGPRNRGVREARAPWIAFLDDDDLWHPRKLECQMRIASEGSCDAVSAPSVPVRGAEEARFDEPAAAYTTRPLRLADVLLHRQPYPATPANVIRRDRLLAVGGFRESPAYRATEDFDLWCRLLASAHFIWQMPQGDTLVRWREAGADGISNFTDLTRPDVIRQRWALLETLARFAGSPLLGREERRAVLSALVERADRCAELSRLAGWRTTSALAYALGAAFGLKLARPAAAAARLVRAVRFGLFGSATAPAPRPASVPPLARAAARHAALLLLGRAAKADPIA